MTSPNENDINNHIRDYDDLTSSKNTGNDKLDVILIIERIGDLFDNNGVDFIINPIKIKSTEIIIDDDKFQYIKNLQTENRSCNYFCINFTCDGFYKTQFHVSSLSKYDDSETHIFTILKHRNRNIIIFDKYVLATKHDLRFNVTDMIITQTGVGLQFDYSNLKYDNIYTIQE